ncbi:MULTISPECIES: hypothetical protein [Clostridium]|jgi:hypothetical protein|uniref:hypothetical protein n=1 Tax=Clostridium TaxID=1485 RepID=UPI000667A883|nr:MULTISPECIES: hypothetical protein [Clostridium]MBS7131783.1 hypothetical protein [Clostridium sp.]MDB2075933.1 hypothetical protein [Clostridium paraputrificum]MDB2080465.1 hypothetical protein [Clostridium paraputrificum]MDB2087255.1 hypothetical protein [Clostridium paraputrificum]MDB2091311.1 hypothetical protein [Clostridium paraputrificum]
MKVKMFCDTTGKGAMVDLPMEPKMLLDMQGELLGRENLGYILGADVKYYDEDNNEIENIFILNKSLF